MKRKKYRGATLPALAKNAPTAITADGARLKIWQDRLGRPLPPLETPTGLSLLAAVRMALRQNGYSLRLLNRRCNVAVSDPGGKDPYPVPFNEWGRFMVRPGMCLYISPQIRGGGGGGKNPLNTILSVVVAVAAIAAATYIPGLGIFSTQVVGAFGPMMPGALAGFGSIAGALAGAAVMMAGMMIVNAIAPISTPKLTGGSANAEKTWAIDGVQNRYAPYEMLPLIFGKVRFAPRYAARPYTLLKGEDQYMRFLFAVAGHNRVTNPRIGDTDLYTYKGVTLITHENWQGEPFTLFPSAVVQEEVGVTLTGENGWFQRTSTFDAVELQFEVYFPSGLALIDSKGARNALAVEFEAEYRRSGTEAWQPFFGDINVQQGEVAYTAPRSPGGSSIWSTTDTSADTVLYADDAGRPNTTSGVKLADCTVTCTWQENPDAPGWPLGNRWTLTGTSMTYTLAPGVTDVALTLQDGFILVAPGNLYNSRFTVTDAQIKGLWRGYARKAPAGQYDLRLRRLTANRAEASSGSATYVDDSNWSVFRSVQSGPVLNYDGAPYTVFELEIQATEQLNGTVSEFNAEFESYAPFWNGTDWDDAPSSNPASLGLGLAFSPHVRKVVPVDAGDTIDWPAWQGFYEWCAEYGWSYNSVQTADEPVREVLHNILASARAAQNFNNTKYSVVWDSPAKEITYPLGPRNSWGFQYSKTFVKEQPHALRVRFLNKERDYQEDERIVYSDNFDHTSATNIITKDYDGVTDPALIYKLARLTLADSVWRPATYELSTDYAYLNFQKGDRVPVTHDVPMWGLKQARVVGLEYSVYDFDALTLAEMRSIALARKPEINPEAAQTTYAAQINNMSEADLRALLEARDIRDTSSVQGVRLDDFVTMEEDKNYAFKYYRSYGNSVSYSVRAEPVSTNLIYFQADLPVADAPDFDGLVHFGEASRETHDCIVTAVTPGENESASISLQDYSAKQIYTALDGPIPPWDSGISLPSRWQLGKPAAPVITSLRTDEAVLLRLGNGSLVPRIQVEFVIPERQNVTPETLYAQIRESGGSVWIDAGSAPPASGLVYVQNVEERVEYEVRLYTVSRQGVISDFSVIAGPVAVIGRTTPPPAPRRVMLDNTRVWWEMPDTVPLDVVGWQVWMSFDEDDDISMGKMISLGTVTNRQFDLSPWWGWARRVWIVTVDELGLTSTPVGALISAGEMPVDNVVVSLSERARQWPGLIYNGMEDGGRCLMAESRYPFWGNEPFWS